MKHLYLARINFNKMPKIQFLIECSLIQPTINNKQQIHSRWTQQHAGLSTHTKFFIPPIYIFCV